MSGTFPSFGLHVAPSAQPHCELWVIGQSLHLLSQGSRVAMSEQQPVPLVMDILGHPSVVGSDDGNPGL